MKVHLGVKEYTVVFLSLAALFVVSLLISFVPLGAWGTAAAIGIGFVKAGLVALFFMHAIEARTSIVIALLSGLFMTFLLIGLMVTDVELRTDVQEWSFGVE